MDPFSHSALFRWDNLSSHTTTRINAAVAAAGHQALCRPVHSPDFGPVEFTFSNLDAFMKRYTDVITPTNVLVFVRFWVRLMHAQPHLMLGYFAGSGYAVPGRPYRPYL